MKLQDSAILRRLVRDLGLRLNDTSGAASIEFAVIAMVLLVMMSAAFDLSRVVVAQRDASRASVELAQTLASCVTSSCILTAGQSVMDAKASIYGNTPGLSSNWVYVSRKSNTVVVSFGNMTYLPSDIRNKALSTLEDNDSGVCTLITYDFKSTIIGLFPITIPPIRSTECAMQAKNIKML